MKADLAQKVLARCTNPRAGEGSTSVVWVAIQGPPSNAGNIVQIGYGTCYPTQGAGNCPGTLSNHDFYAYGRDPNTPGCAGTSVIYPTGHWLSSFDGGTYSVEEDANHDFTLATTNTTVFLAHSFSCWTNQTVAVSTESWDYGDALGMTQPFPLPISLERFKTTPNEAWRVLPSLCNARRAVDQYGVPFALESVFHCFVYGPTINLYTAR